MSIKLPDVNLLVAMSKPEHPHYDKATAWRTANEFATCPITELGLVRVLMQLGAAPDEALAQLASLKKRAAFIPADESAEVIAGKLKSHRQTTDAYLLALAAAHKITLCTFDEGIKGAELV